MRILIVDDHDLVRETIASFLMRSERVYAVEMASDIDEAIRVIEGSVPFDLVLLDYTMPGTDGMAGFKRLKDANGGKPIAIISGTASPAIAKEAIDAGAIGFIPKTLSSKSILSAIGLMADGEVYAPLEFMLSHDEIKPMKNLTSRENEVLECVAEGMSNKEIARKLDLQEVTIKLHVKTLCRKLGAKNRTQAAIMWARNSD